MKKALTLFGLAAATFVSAAEAQLLQYDGFAYTVGSNLAGNGTWSNLNTGTAPIITNGNLTVSGLQAPSGDRVSWDSGNIQEAVSRYGTTNSTGSVFFSFAFQLTNLPTVSAYSFSLAQNTTTFGASVWIRTNGLGGFNLGINKATTSANTTYASGDLSLNTTYFIVGAYDFVAGTVNDVARLWLNPNSADFGAASAPTPSATNTNSSGDLSSISIFQLRGTTGSPGGTMDELRIGTDWASVTPVPEPSTYAMLALAAAGLGAHIVRRRRR